MYVNIKIQTWPPVAKISYAVYGYTTFAHAQFTCASGCKSHSYAIKQIRFMADRSPLFPIRPLLTLQKHRHVWISTFTWWYMGVTCPLAAFGSLIRPWFSTAWSEAENNYITWYLVCNFFFFGRGGVLVHMCNSKHHSTWVIWPWLLEWITQWL